MKSTLFKNSYEERMDIGSVTLSVHYRILNGRVQILCARHGDADIQMVLDPNVKQEIMDAMKFKHENQEA
jgi:hypothetical protein